MPVSLRHLDIMLGFVRAIPATTPMLCCIGFCLSLGQNRWRGEVRRAVWATTDLSLKNSLGADLCLSTPKNAVLSNPLHFTGFYIFP